MVVVSMGIGSERLKTPKVSRFLGGRLRTVRRDSGISTQGQMSGREGFFRGDSS